jgi:hypothetical protein
MRAERLPGFVFRNEHHKRREIRILLAESIAQPCAEARPPGDLRTGLEEGHARPVIDRLGEHRAHHANVIGDRGRVRQQLAEPRARFAVLRKLER